MTAYYNEIDPYAAEWLRRLIDIGQIAPGDVDERDIRDVTPNDLRGYTQCHFFAGIGVWSYALRQAGWPDDRQVWTGSCPCQSFSSAGKRGGIEDDRHLWPHWFHLIEICRPAVVFGEQVASALAIGKTGRKTMHPLWECEANLRILENRLERQLSQCLQGVPEPSCSGVGSDSSLVENLSCSTTDRFCEESSSSKRSAFRSDDGVGSAKTKQGSMRGDRNTVLPRYPAGMEHTVTRSAGAVCGLHEGEHPTCPICGKHGLRRLGGATNEVRSTCSLRHAYGQVQQARTENRRRIEASDGSAWINFVQSDLERAHYAFGACAAPACGFGAPHIRQRLYFVARREDGLVHHHHHHHQGPQGYGGHGNGSRESGRFETVETGSVGTAGSDGGLADDASERLYRRQDTTGQTRRGGAEDCSSDGGVAIADLDGQQSWGLSVRPRGSHESSPEQSRGGPCDRPSPTNGFWRAADWLGCRDGKWRPVEPGTFPLVDGSAFNLDSGSAFEGKHRAKMLSGAGNAIVAPQAQTFIEVYLEAEAAGFDIGMVDRSLDELLS